MDAASRSGGRRTRARGKAARVSRGERDRSREEGNGERARVRETARKGLIRGDLEGGRVYSGRSEWEEKDGSLRVEFQQTPLVAGNPCMFTRQAFPDCLAIVVSNVLIRCLLHRIENEALILPQIYASSVFR